MKRQKRMVRLLLLLLPALSLASLGLNQSSLRTAVALNQQLSAVYDLSWFTIDSGGRQSAGGGYAVAGTIGQSDTGTSSGGLYKLDGGFWLMSGNGGQAKPNIYLPMIVR